MMQSVKKILPFLLLLLALGALTACKPLRMADSEGASPSYRIYITNSTEVPVREIGISQGSSSGGVMNADGSPLVHGDRVMVSVEEKSGQISFEFLGADRKSLFRTPVQYQFGDEEEMHLYLHEEKGSFSLTTTP